MKNYRNTNVEEVREFDKAKGYEILKKIIIKKVKPVIYSFRTKAVEGYLKVGDTNRTVKQRLKEWREVFPDLKQDVSENIKEGQGWSALLEQDDNVLFRDHAVHEYLRKHGHSQISQNVGSMEFFKDATVQDVEEAIKDINEQYGKPGCPYSYYNANYDTLEEEIVRTDVMWKLRDNQQQAVDNFERAVKNGRKNLLMYAVMRFGKSFTSMMCAKTLKDPKLIVVLSAKADVAIEWEKTVMLPKNFEGYEFVDSQNLKSDDKRISKILCNTKKGEPNKVVLFLTLQDLQNTNKEKFNDFFEVNKKQKIDLLLVDETHFAARADKLGKVIRDAKTNNEEEYEEEKALVGEESASIEDFDDAIRRLNVDVTLHLSGTPYRILMGGEFDEEDIISFCQYSDIVDAKKAWIEENEAKPFEERRKDWENPYYGFPEMVRFAFHPSESAKVCLKDAKSNGFKYSFSELLKPYSKDGSYSFVHEKEVLELFKSVDGSHDDKGIFSFLDYPDLESKHIVCVLPYRASCDSLEKLLTEKKDEFIHLGKYKIINISGEKNNYDSITDVTDAISKYEQAGEKTITLTVNRMLTGSTVKEWDTMMYLKDTASPQDYDQAVFRLQSQYIKTYTDDNGDTIKVDMKPQTYLIDFDPYRVFSLQEKKAFIYSVNMKDAETDSASKEKNTIADRIKKDIDISPILTIDPAGQMVQITATNIIDEVSEYARSRSVMEEANGISVDLDILKGSIRNIMLKQADLGSKKGLKTESTDDEDDSEGTNLETTLVGEFKNSDTQTDSSDDQEDSEEINFEKKIRNYYTRVLFYSYLVDYKISDDSEFSIDSILDSLKDENNKRIFTNLGLHENVMKAFKEMNPFTVRDFEYAIRRIYKKANDPNVDELEKAKTIMDDFKVISESEIISPNEICKEMLDNLEEDELIKTINEGGNILDIASKMGEFSIAIYEKIEQLIKDKKIENVNYKDHIYAIPTSNIAYELTRKIYTILGFNIDNIATNFNSYDLLEIKLKDKKNLDLEKIQKLLTQDKTFSNISLTDKVGKSKAGIKTKLKAKLKAKAKSKKERH